MRQSYRMFLMTVEEMSIGRAARRAFVTQQCVSDHIRRLEEEYGVQLFERKPALRLTGAGEEMVRALRNMDILEKNMEATLREFSDGRRGAFAVGISTSRAQILLPPVLKRYGENFPDAEISFYVNDTVVLEEKLLDGKIDLFLGVNTQMRPEFQVMPLAVDKMSLIISRSLFQKFFGSRQLEEFKAGVELSAFSDVPFVLYYETGALNLVIRQHLLNHGIHLKNTRYHISDCDTQINLCISGLCAAIIPEMLDRHIRDHNAKCGSGEEIYVFPIRDFSYPLRVDLVCHRDVRLPFYIRAFCEIMKEEAGRLAEGR